jgi:hypothetical protein
MQSFTLRDPLPWPRAAVWAEVERPAFQAELARVDQLSRTLLDEQVDGPVRRRRVEVVHHQQLPAALHRWTGPHLRYIVEEERVDGQTSLRWRALPARVGDKVQISGTYALVDGPPGPGGAPTCERIVTAQIRVAVFGVGGRIEAGIADGLRRSLELSLTTTRAWLQAHLPPAAPLTEKLG